LLFSDDCNHDVQGLYAQSFEQEMKLVVGEPGAMPKLPHGHAISQLLHFRRWTAGDLARAERLGDDLVHVTCEAFR
jgi:hypothetical protein